MTSQRFQEKAILTVYRRGGITALAEWTVAAANCVNKDEIYDLQQQVDKLKDQLAGRDVPVEWDKPLVYPNDYIELHAYEDDEETTDIDRKRA